jgi:hypothetical protein
LLPCIFQGETESAPILDQNCSEYQSLINMIDNDCAILNDTFKVIEANVPLLYSDLVTPLERVKEIDIFHKSLISYFKQQEIAQKISQITQIFDRLNEFELDKYMREMEKIRDGIGFIEYRQFKADFYF